MTVQTDFMGSSETTFVVKVEATGTSGTGVYSIRPSFSYVVPPHRRAIR
jgi:hypothetical protein